MTWTFHPEPILPAGHIEDPVVLTRAGSAPPEQGLPGKGKKKPLRVEDLNRELWLYYLRSVAPDPNFQTLRLFRRRMADPFHLDRWPEESVPGFTNLPTHTRLYKAEYEPGRRLVSQVWPGLPKCGIWAHLDLEDRRLQARHLVVEPAPNTLYSVAAANPCIRRRTEKEGGGYEIIFEGRNEVVFWRLFSAIWDGRNPAVVDPNPICDGANPSFYDDGQGTLYMYLSVPVHAAGRVLFETRVASRPIA